MNKDNMNSQIQGSNNQIEDGAESGQVKQLQDQIKEMQAKIDELESEDNNGGHKYKGNSWTQMALNDERKQKIRQGKGIDSINSQKVITIIAAIILILSLIIPHFTK